MSIDLNTEYSRTIVPTLRALYKEKFPKSKSFEFSSLKIDCFKQCMCLTRFLTKLMLQTLNAHGNIEELAIGYGYARIITAPLILNRLQKLSWECPSMKTLVISQMPELHSLVLIRITNESIDDLLTFLKSNKSLKTIYLKFSGCVKFQSVMLPIVEIFKIPCTPNRPFVNLKMYSELKPTQVST